MSKKNSFSWGKDDSSDSVHHEEWPWDEDDDFDDDGHPDERSGAEDYYSSRLSPDE